MHTIIIAARPVLAILVLLAGADLLASAPAFCDAPKPCLAIIAPESGAVLSAGPATVIGTAAGEGLTRVTVDVNGKGAKEAAVKGGGFSASVALSPGKNVIRAVAGKTSISVVVSVEASGAYRYHPEIEKCASCHDAAETVHVVAGRKDAICYRCHDRKDAGKHMHGPLGGGDCTACHDPHASGNRSLTVSRPESLCLSCHDQESSTEHFSKARGKACTSCHEPHSSEKAFLQK